MAKNKKASTTIDSPAPRDDRPGFEVAAPTEVPVQRTGSAPARPGDRGMTNPALADQLVGGVVGAAQVVHRVLPNRLPTYLAAGALLVVGVIDPPVALAGGLAYEALRRWTPT